MSVYSQDGFGVRMEWGHDGVSALGGHCAVLVVVDVLVFSTSVDIALGRGGRVLPVAWRDERAVRAARQAGAVVTPSGLTDDGTGLAADRAAGHGVSLRPSSLVNLPDGTVLAISSLNGATLSAAAAGTGAVVLAGCLRNASAVAEAATALAGGRPIGLIPAGEGWRHTDAHSDERPRLRPALEDLLGAGAIAAALAGTDRDDLSPEARGAALTAESAGGRVPDLVAASVSGAELITAGVPGDVTLASAVDSSTVVPMLSDGVFGSA